MGRQRNLVFASALQALCLIAAAPPSPSSSASAPAASNSARDHALTLFQQSETAYREGRLQEAVSLLKTAYAEHPEPVLLYNLSRAYQGLGDLEGELGALTRYLGADPGAPDRKAIEERINVLQRMLRPAPTASTAAPAPSPIPKQPAAPQVLPWIVAGTGLAGIGAGIAFGILSRSRHQDAVDEPIQVEAEARQSEAHTFASVSTIAFVAGGILTGLGITWGVVNWTSAPAASAKPHSLDLHVGANHLLLRGQF